MARYIVTDLTRFSREDEVCTAAIDTETGLTYRPMPYFKTKHCIEINLHPGAILEGEFRYRQGASVPHIEDADHSSRLLYTGPCSKEQFKSVLDMTTYDSISSGFETFLQNKQKHIPIESPPPRSLITIKIDPSTISILEDTYNPQKIKCSFTDKSGQSFHYLSITDRGFHTYAQHHRADGKLAELVKYLRSQDEIYLRIGLSRQHEVGNRNGYWLQVNGIYSFPDFLDEIRSYPAAEIETKS